MCAQFKRWSCTASDLAGLTPRHARNLIVECFFQAQQETMERGREAKGLDTDLIAIHADAEKAVRDAFARSGGDYDDPDQASLERAVDSLLEMARGMGTPADIIRHHEQQIAMMLEGLSNWHTGAPSTP